MVVQRLRVHRSNEGSAVYSNLQDYTHHWLQSCREKEREALQSSWSSSTFSRREAVCTIGSYVS